MRENQWFSADRFTASTSLRHRSSEATSYLTSQDEDAIFRGDARGAFNSLNLN
jgi:hypothetical protein